MTFDADDFLDYGEEDPRLVAARKEYDLATVKCQELMMRSLTETNPNELGAIVGKLGHELHLRLILRYQVTRLMMILPSKIVVVRGGAAPHREGE